MRHDRPAPPSWIDAAILIGFAALGVAVAFWKPLDLEAALGLKPTMPEYEELLASMKARRARHHTPWKPPKWKLQIVEAARLFQSTGAPFLCMFTLGAGLATFRRPRALDARARRGPGVLATGVTSILVFLYLSNEYVLRRFHALEIGYSHNHFSMIWSEVLQFVGFALLAAWGVWLCAGRWRPRPHWRDRLGRGLGAVWLALLLNNKVVFYLFG